MFQALRTNLLSLGVNYKTKSVNVDNGYGRKGLSQIKQYQHITFTISPSDAKQMVAVAKKIHSKGFCKSLAVSMLEFLSTSRFDCIKNWALKTVGDLVLAKIDKLFPRLEEWNPNDRNEFYSKIEDEKGNLIILMQYNNTQFEYGKIKQKKSPWACPKRTRPTIELARI